MSQHPGESGSAAPSRPDDASPRRQVLLVDAPLTRVRRPADLVALVIAVLAIVFVLLLAVYGNATTQGVTEDVQSAVANVLRQVLLLPVTVLEGLVTFFLPIVVLVDRVMRRSWRSALEALATGLVAALLAQGALLVLDTIGPSPLSSGLTITSEGSRVIAMNPYAAGLAGLLTAVGDRSHHRLLRWSWSLLWVVLGLAIVQGDQTLPGALVAVLLGRVAGLAMRYASGVLHERATGLSLVRGLRRAGIDAVTVVRVDHLPGDTAARSWLVTTSSPIGYTEQLRESSHAAAALAEQDEPARAAHHPHPTTPADLLAAVDREGEKGDVLVPDPLTEPDEAIAGARAGLADMPDGESAHRLYAVWDAAGERRDLTVLDGDRHVVGVLASLWDSARMRGLDRRPATNLREAANRAVLMSLSARSAGVRVPELVGVTESRDSVLIVTEHVDGARRLDQLAPEELDDEMLDQVWAQVRAAHAAGLAHRDLHAAAVLVDPARRVWVRDWENGEIVSSELSRRIDLAQLLALVAVLVGTERALSSAGRVLSRDQLASIAPLLQPVALPNRTRGAAVNLKDLLGDLREELIEVVPTADVAPVQLTRFSARTVITATLLVVALWVLLSTLNFEEVATAIAGASPWLMLAAFAVGLLTYVGSGLTLVAFSPEKVGLWQATLVQVSASVVALVAPAGIGYTALNLRFLTKKKVSTPLAVATVGLTQVTQFVTTIVMLVVLALVTGSAGTLSAPSGAVLGAVAAAVVALGALMLVPRLRTWVWHKLAPTLRQVWPRLVWVASSPRRLLVGVGGSLLLTAGYVAAFGLSLAAFGQSLPLTALAITYLASNSIGSVVPSPGGIGPVEAALTGGLALAGVPAATAASVAVLYRLLTFWGRVPLGWAALHVLQRRDVL